MRQIDQGKSTETVLSPYLESIVKRALLYIQAGFPIHLIGPTGVGKTELAFYLADKLNRPYSFIQGNSELSNLDFIGGVSGFTRKKAIDNYIHTVYKLEEQVKDSWIDGPLLEAAKKGYTFIYDEFNRSKPEINNIFLPVLQEKYLPLYGLKTKNKMLPIHSNFSIIFISNPQDYTGSFKTQDALLDRMITFRLNYYDMETEAKIISGKTGLVLEQAKKIANIIDHVRSISTKNQTQAPSLRSAIMIATIAQKSEIKVDYKDESFLTLCKDVLHTHLIGNHSSTSEEELDKLINDLRGWKSEK
jgi:gas vesicle protein GvpN